MHGIWVISPWCSQPGLHWGWRVVLLQEVVMVVTGHSCPGRTSVWPRHCAEWLGAGWGFAW